MGKKNRVELPEFLREIIKIAESGNFNLQSITGRVDVVGGEVVIGEMTDFERAARTHGANANQVVRETCDYLLWASIVGRGITYPAGKNWAGTGLREGGQIVAIPNPPCGICPKFETCGLPHKQLKRPR